MEREKELEKQKKEVISSITDEITKLVSPFFTSPYFEKDDWFTVEYDENEWGLTIFISKHNIPSKTIKELVQYGFEPEIYYDRDCNGMRICLE